MATLQQLYNEKLVSAEKAASAIQSGEHIWFPVGAGEPDIFLKVLVAHKESLQGVVAHQLLPAKPGYFDRESAPHIHHDSLFISGVSREAVNGGWADLSPNHFSEILRLIRDY